MNSYSTLSRKDYENYLIFVYFGPDQDLLKACINRAYRDFNRTLHGFGKFKNAIEIYHQVADLLKGSIKSLKFISANQITIVEFDKWHKETCEQIISFFKSHSYHLFVGQAQKWVNMTLKYIFVVGEQRIPGFETIYPHSHAPLDNILIKQLKIYGFPKLNCAWSRLDNYDEYLQKQNWIRQKFSLVPMDIEFILWLGKEIEPKNIRYV